MRYLIAETSWSMLTLAKQFADAGLLLSRTDRPEDVPHYLQMGGLDAVVLEAETLAHHGLSLVTLRALAPDVPIALIAHKPDRKRISAWLESGADTVIDSSSDPEEIAARIMAVARRTHGFSTSQLQFGPLCVDLERRRVKLGGVFLHLTPKVYELLEYMALRHGTLVTRDALLSHIYGLEAEPDARVFDVYMCTLRGQLKAADGAIRIETARGKGFRFIADLRDAAQAA